MIKRFLIIVCFSMILLSFSCKKKVEFNNYNYGKIDYQVCGLYIEVEKSKNISVEDDENPKVYFRFKDDKYYGFLHTASSSTIIFSNSARQIIEDHDTTIYYGVTNVSFVNEDIKSFKLYPIYLKGSEYIVNKDVYDKVDLSSTTSYEFSVDYTYNNNQIGIQIKLIF